MNDIAWISLLSISPLSELRGAIIYAASKNLSISFVILAIIVNLCVAPLVFLFLSTIHNLLYRLSFYRKIFNASIKKLDKKVEAYEKKHKLLGYFALTLFTAIPLPITGAYTASIIAWILGLNKKKSIIAISLGVILAGIAMFFLAYGLKIFIP